MQDLSYIPNPGHLWFLGNIFIYVLLLSPLFYFLKRNEHGSIHRWLQKMLGNPLGLLLIVVPFILEAELLNPETYALFAFTWHGFFMGFLAFFFGFCCVYSGDAFWQTAQKWKWLFLAIAIILFSIRAVDIQQKVPYYRMAIETNMWIFAVFGFGMKYLNRPSKALNYLSQAAYPVYIIHMFILYLGSWFIMPLGIPDVLKFLSLVIITGAGCFGLYELVIRRIGILRPLFGLKSFEKQKEQLSLKFNSNP